MKIYFVPKKIVQWKVYGEGEPIILLHGLMGGLSNWTEVINYFITKNKKVYIPELPLLRLPVYVSNLPYLVRFLRQFIKMNKLSDYTLVGNSLGGHIALLYSFKYQSEIKSLILTGSSGLYERSLGHTYPHKRSYDFLKEKIKEVFYSPEMVTDELVDEVFQIITNRYKLIRVITFAKSAIRNNVANKLKLIRIPVGIIWGKQDRITPPAVAEEFNDNIYKTSLYWIDKCGHAPMWEKPQQFIQHMEAFMNSVVR